MADKQGREALISAVREVCSGMWPEAEFVNGPGGSGTGTINVIAYDATADEAAAAAPAPPTLTVEFANRLRAAGWSPVEPGRLPGTIAARKAGIGLGVFVPGVVAVSFEGWSDADAATTERMLAERFGTRTAEER